MDGGNENHRNLLVTWMFADHRRELETVEIRHANINQDDSDIGFEEMLERLAPGRRFEKILAEARQNSLIGQKLAGLIVDEKDVDLF